jgi:prepilin-type N-terminal cleavage/methylation domain-containing protein
MKYNLKKIKFSAGFTLTEVLAVSAIMTIVIAGLATLFLAQARLTKNEIKAGQSQIELGLKLGQLVREISQGESIVASATYGSDTYYTGSDVLIITYPGQAQPRLYLNDDERLIRLGEGGERLILQHLSQLNFTYEDNDNLTNSRWVEITLVTDKDLTMRATLKNKWPTNNQP